MEDQAAAMIFDTLDTKGEERISSITIQRQGSEMKK